MTKPKPIIHSHSGLEMYVQCPHKFMRLKVAKDIKDDFGGPAAQWGIKVHKAFQDLIEIGKPLPANMAQWEQVGEFVRSVYGDKYCELKLSVRADGTPADGFFAKDGFLRGAIDLLVMQPDQSRAIVVDYKTNQKFKNEPNQAARNAILVFSHYPEIEHVTTRFLYLVPGKVDTQRFTRTQFGDLLADVVDVADSVKFSQENDSWPKRQSGLCGWCPVKDCEHWFDGPAKKRR